MSAAAAGTTVPSAWVTVPFTAEFSAGRSAHRWMARRRSPLRGAVGEEREGVAVPEPAAGGAPVGPGGELLAVEAAQARGDVAHHRLVGRLGVVGVEFVEVHVARVGGALVLEDRDLGEAGDPGGGDVADVDEVAPVPQAPGL